MNAPRFALVALLLAAPAIPLHAAEVDTSDTRIVSKDQLAQVAIVRDVVARDGEVSGVVVNRSSQPIRDVELRIRHQFLWADEFHPGPESPSRTEEDTVAGEIPPGGSAPFTHRGAPLPERKDGHFETVVEVAAVTHLSRSDAPPVTSSPSTQPPY